MPEQDKELMRKQLKDQRQSLNASLSAKASRIITEACLKKIDWASVKSLHTYLPINKWGEIDTWPLLKTVWQRWPHVVTAAPRVINTQLEAVGITSDTGWREHAWGMPEPIGGEVLPADYQFDIIIVPMLGFDAKGYRLGYGGGFYDRFLAAQPQALTIGLCYQFGFIEQGMPHEPHDIPLKRIITESRIYNFS